MMYPLHCRSVILSVCFYRFTESRNQTRTGSGFTSVGVGQFQRPQVSMAWIRKTRIQTSVRTVELRGSELDQGLIFTHRTDPDNELDQGKPVPERQAIETISKVSCALFFTVE